MNDNSWNDVVHDNAQVKKQPLHLLIVAIVMFDDVNEARAMAVFVTDLSSEICRGKMLSRTSREFLSVA